VLWYSRNETVDSLFFIIDHSDLQSHKSNNIFTLGYTTCQGKDIFIFCQNPSDEKFRYLYIIRTHSFFGILQFIEEGSDQQPGHRTAKDYAIDYLNKFSSLAVSEMKRTGIPASITWHGMLESNYGRSRLATQGNTISGSSVTAMDRREDLS
jgi:hypothetical protein